MPTETAARYQGAGRQVPNFKLDCYPSEASHFMSSAVIDFFTPSAQRRVGLGQEADHAAL
jgi:hypothetical protein